MLAEYWAVCGTCYFLIPPLLKLFCLVWNFRDGLWTSVLNKAAFPFHPALVSWVLVFKQQAAELEFLLTILSIKCLELDSKKNLGLSHVIPDRNFPRHKNPSHLRFLNLVFPAWLMRWKFKFHRKCHRVWDRFRTRHISAFFEDFWSGRKHSLEPTGRYQSILERLKVINMRPGHLFTRRGFVPNPSCLSHVWVKL